MNAPYLRVEDPYRYTPGGYHPVHIDDTLHNGRYRILHKLGHGSFSTVWLALNQHCQDPRCPSERYVAVKIHTADSPPSETNAHILHHLASSQPTPPLPPLTSRWSQLVSRWLWVARSEGDAATPDVAQALLPLLLDEFDLTGPNGTHRCHIMPVVGPSVAALKHQMKMDPLPLDLARRACLQVARAVSFLHSRGVVHGDLHMGNCTVGRPVMDDWTVDELYEQLGVPEQIPVPLDEDDDEAEEMEDSGENIQQSAQHDLNTEASEDDPPLSPPHYAVPPVRVERFWNVCASRPSIGILDFGESWLNDVPGILLPPGRKIPGTPTLVSPPEILVAHSVAEVSAASDVWTLACTLYELLADHPFFHMFWGDASEVIADIVALQGRLPERWWRLWRGRKRWFDDEGEPQDERGTTLRANTIEERVKTARGSERMEAIDAEVLLRVLKAALRVEPMERVTAGEMVEMLEAAWGDGM